MNKFLRDFTLTKLLLATAIIVSPLYVVRWSYFGQYPTTLLEFVIWLIILTWVVGKIWQRDWGVAIDSRLRGPIGLIMIASVISIFVAPDYWAAFGIWRAYFLEPILIYLVISDLLAKLKDHSASGIKYLILNTKYLIPIALLIAALWLSVLGILQFAFQWFIITPHQWDRAHGVFNNGNALALFIGVVLVILIPQLAKVTRKFSTLSLLAVILLITAFFATKSTGGFLALAATLSITFLVKKFHLSRLIAYSLFLLLALFILFLTQITHFTPTTTNPWVRSGGTAITRLCVWEGTWNLIQDRPILGAGLGGFQQIYTQDYVTCDAEPLMYPHNIFLNFWSEIGILGLVGFGWLFFVIMGGRKRGLVFFYEPAFVYLILHGLVDVPYFKNDLAVVFWILVALWSYQSRVLEDPSINAQPRARALVFPK